MSEIAKRLDPKAAAMLGTSLRESEDGCYVIGADGVERSPVFLGPRHLVEDLDQARLFVSGETFIDGTIPVPRFGVLSLLAHSTPMYVYDHPVLNDISKTAFTDGLHVFIHSDFYEKLNKDVEASNFMKYGIELLILHELMHKLYNHTRRLRAFPPDLANIATDLSINTKLQAGFPELAWVPTLRETALGFKPGDIEKYVNLSEETIARELFNELLKKGQGGPGDGKGQGQGQGKSQGQGQGQGKSQGQGQGKSQGKSQGQGQGKGQGGSTQPGDGQEAGGQEPGGGNEPSDSFNGNGDNHMIDLEDFIKILEDNGMEAAISGLSLPRSEDVEEIGRVQEEEMMRRIEAVQKAEAQMNQCGGKYPGAHIASSAGDMIRGFTKGKLAWKLALRQVIYGDGMQFRYNSEEPGEPYFVEHIEKLTGVPLWIGQDLPFKPDETVLVLIDTSGSVGQDDLRSFLNEIFELKRSSSGFGDSASEVVVMWADTVLRGDPIIITESNMDELLAQGVEAKGRGGTDLCNDLNMALKTDILKEKKIRSVVFFTDLFDTPPKRSQLEIPENTSIVYVAAPSTASAHQEEFAKAVESYARVVTIREGTEVDLSEDTLSMPVSPSRRAVA